jgi:hypothetical protein
VKKVQWCGAEALARFAKRGRVVVECERRPEMSSQKLEGIDAGVGAALQSLHDTMKANARTVEPEPEKKLPAKVIQLPLWGEARRAAPNAVFRSALFPAVNFQNGRPYLERQEIFSVRGIKVVFTGKRFDQSDLDVYLELLDLARLHPLGEECCFTAKGMLKRLGRTTGKSGRDWLHAVLTRLTANAVDITDHEKRYFGPLLFGGTRDERTKQYRININSKFARLFGYGMWSSIDREQRHQLGRNATAKALHAYYSTHAAPGAHSFETLAGIVGLNYSNKRDERARLIEAHDSLKQLGFLRDYSVSEDGETIKVHNRPTPGQARHIVTGIIKQRHEGTSHDPE